MKNKTAARIQVRDSLIALIESRDDFREALLEDYQLPAWVYQENGESEDSRTLASRISLKLTYNPDQPGQETIKLTGLVGISSETYDIGQTLNQSKTDFKAAMVNYRSCFGHGFDMTELSSKELREGLLGKLNIQHIHFVQCYRQLKFFQTPPRRVGFSWATGTHGTVRLTRDKAIDHIRRNFTPSLGLTEDIRLVETMTESCEVVIKRPLAPHLRANLTWPDPISAERKISKEARKQWPGQINTPLPVFLQLEKGENLPEFNRIKPWNPEMKQERLQRSDTCLKPLSKRPGSMLYVPA
ncbi:hypothetical protein M3P05_19500 [Sansalvadorimonas sp. 2012CJ34-2]|uniref:DNA replication terminus site-binding protein n=1 Tax=Parendozoicomonas callyspongiae TaxID=2942213 RepID=A0ABT0PMA2_9GAMM|nr:hypothetical protein [Sansalvadorimonas sp. 2012CJ34-2]MCL6272111.1 hypothetical protein [Sansalvadorimonas sp. 2012CJ34-2]